MADRYYVINLDENGIASLAHQGRSTAAAIEATDKGGKGVARSLMLKASQATHQREFISPEEPKEAEAKVAKKKPGRPRKTAESED